jgi:hypothetical protein
VNGLCDGSGVAGDVHCNNIGSEFYRLEEGLPSLHSALCHLNLAVTLLDDCFCGDGKCFGDNTNGDVHCGNSSSCACHNTNGVCCTKGDGQRVVNSSTSSAAERKREQITHKHSLDGVCKGGSSKDTGRKGGSSMVAGCVVALILCCFLGGCLYHNHQRRHKRSSGPSHVEAAPYTYIQEAPPAYLPAYVPVAKPLEADSI